MANDNKYAILLLSFVFSDFDGAAASYCKEGKSHPQSTKVILGKVSLLSAIEFVTIECCMANRYVRVTW